MSINIANNRIVSTAKVASVDQDYGPYSGDSLQSVLEHIDYIMTPKKAVGKTFGVIVNEKLVEYWYQYDGDGNVTLQRKNEDSIGKVVSATEGDIAVFDNDGGVQDSGFSVSDFATSHQGELADTAYQKPETNIPISDLSQEVVELLGNAGDSVREIVIDGQSYYPDNGVVELPFETEMTDQELKDGEGIAPHLVTSKLLKDNFDIEGRTVKMRDSEVTVPQSVDELDGIGNYYTKTETDRFLSEKQDNLTFDLEPIEGSPNPVTSGGIADAIQNIQVEVSGIIDDDVTSHEKTWSSTKINQELDTKADNNAVVHLTGNETIYGTKLFMEEAYFFDNVNLLGTNNIANDLFTQRLRIVSNGTGGIYASGRPVTGIPTPTDDDHAANKKYVDDGLATKQDTIVDLTTIRSGAAAGATAVQPDAMQEALLAKQDVLEFDITPTDGSLNPVRSDGVYDALQSVSSDIITTLGDYYTKTETDNLLASKASNNAVVHLTGNETITGKKTFADDFIISNQNGTGRAIISSLIYNDGHIGLSLGGENSDAGIDGDVEIQGVHTPTTGNAVATKEYVDDGLATKQDVLTFDQVPTDGSTNPVESGGVYDAIEAAANDVATTLANYYTKMDADGRFVHLTGDEKIGGEKTFSQIIIASDGVINMNGAMVANLGKPTNDFDAATKQYVDGRLATKQDTLTFDAEPTDGSDNPVTSNGVYDALAAATQDMQTVLADYYTKTETNTLLSAKANDAAVVHKEGDETIDGNKYFYGETRLYGNVRIQDGENVQISADEVNIGGGIINFGNNVIHGAGTPTADSDVATKKYVDDGLDGKQDVIANLSTIISGAAAGATAVQPAQLDLKQDILTFDRTPTSGSTNPVESQGIKLALDVKQNVLRFDQIPTQDSTNPVTSNGIKDYVDTLLDGKQDTLQFDNTPTESSVNPVDSNGIYQALQGKQDVIQNLQQIIAGAALGASSLQAETDPVFCGSAAYGITQSDITNWNGKTDNVGTITGITMNGQSVGTSGNVDLGNVVTQETELSGQVTGSGNAVTDVTVSGHQINITKGKTFLETFVETDPTVPSYVKQITQQDISYWNGKQNALTFDTMPTEGSDNPVTSDGIRNAIDDAIAIQSSWTQQDSSNPSFIIGKPKVASGTGSNSIVENELSGASANTASGNGSHAEGVRTEANGDYSHSEGFYTQTNNVGEHASGRFNVSSTYEYDDPDKKTQFSIGVGSDNNNRKNAIEVMQNGDIYVYNIGGYVGNNAGQSGVKKLQSAFNGAWYQSDWENDDDESGSFVRNRPAIKKGSQHTSSTIEGFIESDGTHNDINAAMYNYSHAEGYSTKAQNVNSHSEGYHTMANGESSHAEGGYTITRNEYEHAQGMYNVSNASQNESEQTLMSVGIGSDNEHRMNSIEVMKNGDIYIYNVGNYDGTNPDVATRLQDLISSSSIQWIELGSSN